MHGGVVTEGHWEFMGMAGRITVSSFVTLVCFVSSAVCSIGLVLYFPGTISWYGVGVRAHQIAQVCTFRVSCDHTALLGVQCCIREVVCESKQYTGCFLVNVWTLHLSCSPNLRAWGGVGCYHRQQSFSRCQDLGRSALWHWQPQALVWLPNV